MTIIAVYARQGAETWAEAQLRIAEEWAAPLEGVELNREPRFTYPDRWTVRITGETKTPDLVTGKLRPS